MEKAIFVYRSGGDEGWRDINIRGKYVLPRGNGDTKCPELGTAQRPPPAEGVQGDTEESAHMSSRLHPGGVCNSLSLYPGQSALSLDYDTILSELPFHCLFLLWLLILLDLKQLLQGVPIRGTHLPPNPWREPREHNILSTFW